MRALGILGSRKLGWLLAIGLVGIYLWLSFSGDDPMGRWLHVVFYEPLGMVLWFGLALNLMLRSLWLIIDRLRSRPPAIDEMDNVAEIDVGDDFSDWLRDHFGIEFMNKPVAVRQGRYSALPGVLWRIGAVIVMAALLVSSHVRVDESARFSVLQSGKLLGQDVTLTALDAGLPENYLSTGDDAAFSLRKPEATLHLVGRSFTLHESHPGQAEGIYYRMTDIGFFLPVTVSEGAEALDVGGHVEVLPPGRAVNIFVPSFDAVLNLKLAPESTVQKGLITGEVYDLVKPAYAVSVKRGTADIESTTLKAGQSAVISGLPLSLGKTGMSVEIQAVRDPALWWFRIGLWLLMAGIALSPLRLILYVKEIRVELSDGKARVGYSEEFFKKWATVRFETWARERQGINS